MKSILLRLCTNGMERLVILGKMGIEVGIALAAFCLIAAHAQGIEFPLKGENGEWIFNSGSIETYSLSQDGRSLAVENDLGLFVWDVSLDGPTVKNFKQGVMCEKLSFRPDGKLVTVGDRLSVWDVETMEETAGFVFKDDLRDRGEFSSNGRFIARLGKIDSNKQYALTVWNLETLETVSQMSLDGTDGTIYCIKISPDGRYFFAWLNNVKEARIWDLQNPGAPFVLKTDEPQSFSVQGAADFSPDGQFLAAGSSEGNVYLWNLENPDYLWKRAAGPELVYYVKFEPDGNGVLVDAPHRHDQGGGIGMCLLSAETGETSIEFEETNSKSTKINLNYSESGTTACGFLNGEVLFWNGLTGVIERRFQGDHQSYTDLTVSPTGTLAAARVSSSESTTVKVFDYKNGKEVYSFENPNGYLRTLAFSPDGSLLFACGNQGVDVFELSTGQRIGQLQTRGFVMDLTVSKDNRYAFTLPTDYRACQKWDVQSGENIKTFGEERTGTEMYQAVEFSPSDDRYAIVIDSVLEIRNADTDEAVLTKDLSDLIVYGVNIKYSAEGSLLYFTTGDTNYAFDAYTGDIVRTYEIPMPSGLYPEYVSIDEGSQILMGSSNPTYEPSKKLTVCDLTDGLLYESAWRAGGAAFSPDGETVVLIFQGGTVRAYDSDAFAKPSGLADFWLY